PDADGKPASFKRGFEIKDAEHLHSVFGDGVFVTNDCDMPKRKRLGKGFDDEVMSERMMAFRAFRRWHHAQLFPSDLVAPAMRKQLGLIHKNQFLLFQCAGSMCKDYPAAPCI